MKRYSFTDNRAGKEKWTPTFTHISQPWRRGYGGLSAETAAVPYSTRRSPWQRVSALVWLFLMNEKGHLSRVKCHEAVLRCITRREAGSSAEVSGEIILSWGGLSLWPCFTQVHKLSDAAWWRSPKLLSSAIFHDIHFALIHCPPTKHGSWPEISCYTLRG